MRIAIGSTNPVKVAAARAVIERLYAPEVEIIVVGVDSGVADQPWGDAETRRGALMRARRARAESAADLGLGLEGGVLELEGELYTSAWCAVVDADGQVGLAGGANMLLPPAVADDVRRGMELGAAMDRLTGKHDTGRQAGAIGTLTQGRLTRRSAFEHVLMLAFARLLSPHFYPSNATE